MTDGRTVGRVLQIAFAFLSVSSTVRLSAQEPPLNAGALFLVFPVGAQAVGMGQTATAASGRGEAAFWNPAGLALMADDEFALHSATLVAGKSHVLGAYFPSRGIGVFGGALYLVDYGDLERTDGNGNTIARIAPRNFEFMASYATTLAGSAVSSVSGEVLTAPAMNALNNFDHPNAVKPARFGGYKLQGSQLALSIPPKSVVVLELK